MSQEEKILQRVPLEIIIASFLLAIPGFILFDTVTAMLVAGGGCISALSFAWLNRSLAQLLLSGKRKALKSVLPLFGLRLLLLLVLFLIIIFFFSRKIIAFVAGFSVVIPVFLAEAVFALSKMKQWKS